MKATLSTIATVALILPAAWTMANAQDTSVKPAMTQMAPMHAEASAWGHPGQASAVSQVIHIRIEGMRFAPDKLTIRAGSTVKFVIANPSKTEHELVLGPKSEQQEHEKGMQAMEHMQNMQGMKNTKSMMSMSMDDPNEVELPPGATKTLIWTFTRPGTYQYGCHMPGHYNAGMFGIVTVVKGH